MKFVLAGCILWALLRVTTVAQSNEFLRTYPPGEKLTYRLYWGVLPVGSASLSTDWIDYEGRRLLALRAYAKTTSVLDYIYPVSDWVESVVDPETMLPVRYVQKLREGKHRRDDTIVFDHAARIAYWHSGLTGASNTIPIQAESRDVLSFVYFMRSKGMDIGEQRTSRVIVDNKTYDLEVTALGREPIDVDPYGKVECLKLEPKAKFGAIFVRKGKVMSWFSADPRRICVRVTGKVPVANVKACLLTVEGPADEFWSTGESGPPEPPPGETNAASRLSPAELASPVWAVSGGD